MSSMYAENVVDHYKFPRNFGRLENADIKARDVNPLCGDEIGFDIELDNNQKMKNVKFNGRGCAICMATSSMLTEKIMGKDIDEIEKLSGRDVIDLLKIEISPNRMKCAMLPLAVLKLALETHRNKVQ